MEICIFHVSIISIRRLLPTAKRPKSTCSPRQLFSGAILPTRRDAPDIVKLPISPQSNLKTFNLAVLDDNSPHTRENITRISKLATASIPTSTDT